MKTKTKRKCAKSAKVMIEKTAVWGCAIGRSNIGGYFLAHSESAAPMLFWNRSDAVKHKRALKEHEFRARVVPVVMTFKYLVPK